MGLLRDYEPLDSLRLKHYYLLCLRPDSPFSPLRWVSSQQSAVSLSSEHFGWEQLGKQTLQLVGN